MFGSVRVHVCVFICAQVVVMSCLVQLNQGACPYKPVVVCTGAGVTARREAVA